MVASPRRLPVRVLVAEDDDEVATLIKVMLAGDERLRIVGRARDGREALSLGAALDPDVILMDVQMPLMDGVEATRNAGADAFVTKLPTAEELIAVIMVERAPGEGRE